MEIKQLETLNAAEQDQLFGWGEDIFKVQSWALKWRHKDLHFVGYDRGEPVSHVGILRHKVTVNDEAVLVAGLGGVVTTPNERGRGFAKQLVRQAMGFAETEWKASAGLLFCRPQMVPYYESLGWKVVASPVFIEQPSGDIPSPLQVMVIPFGEFTWPAGRVALRSLPW